MKILNIVALVGLIAVSPTTMKAGGLAVYDEIGHMQAIFDDLNRGMEHAETMGQWAEQLMRAAELVSSATTMVQQGMDQLNRMGDPSAITGIVGDVAGFSDVTGMANMPDMSGVIAAADGAKSLGYSFNGLYEAIGEEVDANGVKLSRNVDSYKGYSYIEQLLESFQKASQQHKQIQERESQKQQTLAGQLDAAKDDAEVQKIQSAIAVSQGISQASADELNRRLAELNAATEAQNQQNDKIAQAKDEEDKLLYDNAVDAIVKEFDANSETLNEYTRKSVDAMDRAEQNEDNRPEIQ